MQKLLFIALIAITIVSCDDFTRGKKSGALATGKPGEILLVCTDDLWNSSEIDSLIYALAEEVEPYYPLEYKFKFYHKNAGGFNHLHKKVRNILIVQQQDNAQYSPAKIEFKQDKWVKGQTVVEISFKELSDLLQVIKYDALKISKRFEEGEIARNIEGYKLAKMKPLGDKVFNKYGMRIDFPAGAQVLSDKNEFMRIDIPDRSREMKLDGGANYETQRANFIQSSLLMWQQDYRSKDQLSKASLLASQDSIFKLYAPHHKEGAYMATEYDSLVYPLADIFEFNGLYTVEMKGQYRMNGRDDVFMGGPFVSFSFVNPNTNKLITLYGMVHGPSEPLINYIREHQSLFRTIQLD